MDNVKKIYDERLSRVNDAIAIREPDRVPIFFITGTAPYALSEDATYKDSLYDLEKAGNAFLKFHEDFPMDASNGAFFVHGEANELSGINMIDWPGRPGTTVPNTSSFQVIEQTYLLENEYNELLTDFTGFMLRKYIPRAYSNISGLKDVNFAPQIILGVDLLAPLHSQAFLDSVNTLNEIGKLTDDAIRINSKYNNKLNEMGFPIMYAGVGEAPFDILSDYYRGTIESLIDLSERPDLVLQACEMFADRSIAMFQYLKNVPKELRKVSFPLHKGMDSFMSDEQYEKFYWRPFKRVLDALIEIDAVPVLFCEGKYKSRLKYLAELPKGSSACIFEDTDMVLAKKEIGNNVCIMGNLSVYLLEHGTVQEVIDETKRLIDECAPGGGFILSTNMVLDGVKRENLEAMFETCRNYGKR